MTEQRILQLTEFFFWLSLAGSIYCVWADEWVYLVAAGFGVFAFGLTLTVIRYCRARRREQ